MCKCVGRMGMYVKIKAIQYLWNTCYVPGQTLDTPSLIFKVSYALQTEDWGSGECNPLLLGHRASEEQTRG